MQAIDVDPERTDSYSMELSPLAVEKLSFSCATTKAGIFFLHQQLHFVTSWSKAAHASNQIITDMGSGKVTESLELARNWGRER